MRILFIFCLSVFLFEVAWAEEDLVRKAYNLPNEVFMGGIGGGFDAGSDPTDAGSDPFGAGADPFGGSAFRDPSDDFKHLQGLMKFPEGSLAFYMPMFERLILTTTPEAHKTFEEILPLLQPKGNDFVKFVEIDFTLVEFSMDEIRTTESFKAKGSPSAEDALALLRAGKGDILGLSKIVTLSGVNAQTEGVEEFIYPTEFEDIEEELFEEPEEDGPIRPPGVVPGAFETREIGVILNVTPTLSPRSDIINLALIPERAEFLGWIPYSETKLAQPKEAAPGMDMLHPPALKSQPIFRSINFTTSIAVLDGETEVIGSVTNPKTGNVAFGLITATVKKGTLP